MARKKSSAPRFGIGEWYGYDILKIPQTLRVKLAEEALKSKGQRTGMPCPFQPAKSNAICNKAGGVCSLRQYAPGEDGQAIEIQGLPGSLRATCPKRFDEGGIVHKWVSQSMINDLSTSICNEITLSKSSSNQENENTDDVSRFDTILIGNNTPTGADERWVPLEIQSVYFSGDAMRQEFESIKASESEILRFPVGKRRPDYKSCAQKRLFPQLQVKITTLRRWGKKMAIVVDRAFFESLGEIESVEDLSNADIAWFVLGFGDGSDQRSGLVCEEVRLTTLEKTIEMLTGGQPVSLRDFEAMLKSRIVRP